MADRVASDSGLSPWAAILLEIAQPILESDDIRQALDQAETDADTLRGLIVEHTAELIEAGPSATYEFASKINWDFLPISRSSRILAGKVFLFLIAAVTLGVFIPDFLSWVWWPCGILLFLGASLVFLLFMLSTDSVRGPLEPVGSTRDDLRHEVVEPFLREQINRILDEQEHPVMRVTSAPGLAELSDREQLVITESMLALGGFTRDMSSGSIGVSGPRGVGKSTLLRYFSDPSFEPAASDRNAYRTSQDLRFMATAPVDYDARQFVLHVFSKLCEEVLKPSSTGRGGQIHRLGSRWVTRILPILLAILLIASALIILTFEFPRPASYLPAWTRAAAATVGIVVLAIVLFSWWLSLIRSSWRFPEKTRSLRDEAKYWSVRIKYLQSFTAGSSGSMGIPVGTQLGVTAMHQVSEIPMTLPELVDTFRDFAARVIGQRRQHFKSWSDLAQQIRDERLEDAKLKERRADLMTRMAAFFRSFKLPSRFSEWAAGISEAMRNYATATRESQKRFIQVPDFEPRIVIGIDEVDKIDADLARRFLNDIKAIFGMPNCLYLVSVSDEALEVFEQRILLGRTAFDSAFDEISRVQPLNFDACRHLLRRRIAGIPDSLIAFCQVMSGGLPRDMIRTARSILDVRMHRQALIMEIVHDIVASEIQTLKRACIADLARVHTEASTGGFPAVALKDDWPGRTSVAMITAVEKDFMNVPVPLSFRVGLYFYTTVAEVFTDGLSVTTESLRRYNTDDNTCIDRLAQARNTIGVNPEVAWELITRFRAARGLRTLREPWSLLSAPSLTANPVRGLTPSNMSSERPTQAQRERQSP